MSLDSEYQALRNKRKKEEEQMISNEIAPTIMRSTKSNEIYPSISAPTITIDAPVIGSTGVRYNSQIASRYEGNVDIYNRKRVKNSDGTYSTVASEWVNFGDTAVHYTPIIDGKYLDRKELESYLQELGNGSKNANEFLENDKIENGGLGIVLRAKDDYNEKEENEYGENLHKQQERFYSFNQNNTSSGRAFGTNTYFQKPKYFDDGYDAGDITKTILGTVADVGVNLAGSIGNISEGLANTLATGYGKLKQKSGFYKDYNPDDDQLLKEFLKERKSFSADSITDSILFDTGYDVDKASVFGEKLDSTVQSGGQMLVAGALQGIGIPWWATMGTSTFGDKMSSSLKEDATFNQAMVSSAISTAGELLTEKIAGIKFGGKALDDALTRTIATNITDSFARSLVSLGIDVVGEGVEEVLSEAIGNFGDWLTYKNGEKFSDVMASKEALQQYVDSFVGGALLGGIGGGVEAIDSARNGVDYTNKLDKQSDSVVNQEYKNRVEQAEKDGKKLSFSEKNKLYDKVLDDLGKGYISTETIGDVLGDDTYKAYKNLTESRQNALKSLIEEKGKLESEIEEFTNSDEPLGDSRLYSSIQSQLEDVNNQIKDLKDKSTAELDQITEYMSDKVKDSRLSESYNEFYRRRQKFDADVSKYDEKQRATVQSAIDSGVLNNTNRSHDLVDMISKVSADKGITFNFTDNENLKKSGFALEDGITANAFVENGNVTLNMDSRKSLDAVVGHEVTHVLEGTELYDTLKDAIVEYAKTKGEYDSRLEALTKLYEGKNANVEQELVSDLVGDYLFTDESFVRSLSTENRNVFQKIYDEIKYLCKVATAGSKEARELEKVKKVFEDIYRESGEVGNKANADTNGEVRYSLTLKYKNGNTVDIDKVSQVSDEEIDKYITDAISGKIDKYSYFPISRKTPNIIIESLNDVGIEAKDLPLIMQAKKLEQSVSRKIYGDNRGHKLTKGNIKSIIEALETPSNIIYQTNRTDKSGNELPNNVAVLVEYNKVEALGDIQDGVAIIEFDPNIDNQFIGEKGETNFNTVVTIFEPDPVRYGEAYDYYDELINKEGNYEIKIKEKTESNQSYTRATPEIENNLSSTNNVPQEVQDVNTNSTDNTNLQYSLSKDSDGRELSEQQREYFINSKVRDADGNLLRVYHGTDAEFTVFDRTKGRHNMDIQGSFFSPWELDSQGYGANVKAYYLNITNPASEQMGYKALRMFQGQNNAGVKAREYLESLGYDGVNNSNEEYIAFDSNQIKLIDNTNPTENEDIRLSLSKSNEEQAPGRFMSEDIAYRDDSQRVQDNANDIAPLTDEFDDVTPSSLGDVIGQRREELREAGVGEAPIEKEPTYSDGDSISLDANTLNNAGDILSEELSLNTNEVKAMKEILQDYSKSGTMSRDDLYRTIKEKFGDKEYVSTNEEIADVKQALRGYKLFVSPTIKGDITDYSAFRKSNFNKLSLSSKEGLPVDTAYQELSEMYPEFFPDDITNATDQLLKISEVANLDSNEAVIESLDEETIQEATDLITDIVSTYKDVTARNLAIEERNELADAYGNGNVERPRSTTSKSAVAPFKEATYSSDGKYRSDFIDQILTDESEKPKRKSRAWSKFVMSVVDKASPIENLALETGNRELDARYQRIRTAEGQGQTFVGNGDEDAGIKSVKEIFNPAEKSGLKKEFFDYLLHRHNVDRMSLVDRFGAKENKAVFDNDVTADISQEVINKYEAAYPQFREWAEDVYNYNDYLLQKSVEGGLVSQETASKFRQMYPHYVPIRRALDSAEFLAPIPGRKAGVGSPIKQATGGNSNIEPLDNTMAQRGLNTFKAVAKNRFGSELLTTLQQAYDVEEVDALDVLDNIDSYDDLLKVGSNGKAPTLTIFQNGDKVTFPITEDIYESLKPTSEGLAYRNPTLSKINSFRRGLLTEYNPTFMFTNAIKDAQDVLINSQHAAKTYATFPKAIKELATKGEWYKEYIKNGGDQVTYFDKGTNSLISDEKSGIKKIIGMPLEKISEANEFIEKIPRLSEYIASREQGRSIDVSLLDSARVTTNFSAGGDVTKFLNGNGATFLNASVQGFAQQVRNVREAKYNGLKGWTQLAAKTMIAGLPALLLNGLIWKDDEDYEELSDYIKDNYYVIAKFGDGKFVRIPKGRALAVVQNAFTQVYDSLTGNDEIDLQRFLDLAVSNLAPNNPIDNNILAPITQAVSGKTWYGDDLVPTRLQDLPDAEQYDENIDSISKWLGEKTNISPYKINYLLDQYSGGIGDVLLPMMTPKAENGSDSLGGNIIAPMVDKFTTDSVLKNKSTSEFYDLSDELKKNANSKNATAEDVLKAKYINSVQSELSGLYKQRREIQNSNLSDATKYNQVRELQKQINELLQNAVDTYDSVEINGNYATVGDRQYRLNDKGSWEKISDEQQEKQDKATSELGITESEYWNKKDEYDTAIESPEKYAVAKAVGGLEAYNQYSKDLNEIPADKDSNGKAIRNSRKPKVVDYINNLDADYYSKIILYKSQYKSDDTYNKEIIDYLNSRDDISYDEMKTILEGLGATVDSNGNISW